MNITQQGVDISKEKLLSMYTSMMRIRKFEEKIISFYTLGKLPSFPHAYIGEEAVGVGVTANLRDDDWITSTHRAEGHVLASRGGAVILMDKPSRMVRPGDSLELIFGDRRTALRIEALGMRRGPAPEARALYTTADAPE